MKKLALLKERENPQAAYNAEQLMNSFQSATFIPNHLQSRFSNPAVSAQRGFYQRVNGIVFVHIEICPDINNPFGGGATVSFSSGDVITAPIATISPQIYMAGDWIGQNSFTLTQLSNGTKYTNCKIVTNNTTGSPEIQIFHNINATASTFILEGWYIVRN